MDKSNINPSEIERMNVKLIRISDTEFITAK